VENIYGGVFLRFFLAVDCVWDLWSNWTSCSALCNSGIQNRTRSIKSYAIGGRNCDGNSTEIVDCNVLPCSK
jgi:hypothetical protein